MEYLVAVILGVIVAGFAATTGFDRDRSFYPTVLIVVGSYYPLFAVMGASGYATLGIEIAVGLVFSGPCGTRLQEEHVAGGSRYRRTWIL